MRAAGHDIPGRPGADPLLGRTINDRYVLKSVIARGGMGKVYRGVQLALDREVAIKIFDPISMGHRRDEFNRRFLLEASTLAKLRHPNTVTVFDYGCSADGIYFIAMELLDGKTLHSVIRREGSLAAGRAVHITKQIAQSIDEAHLLGVVHRDLKPANILLTSHSDEVDFVKVLDFGLVKDVTTIDEDLTQDNVFLGSPKYVSPEQIEGREIDPRTDIYSLGILLYEMLSGKAPFTHDTALATLKAHLDEAPPPLVGTAERPIPPALVAVVERCLEKDPELRFSTVRHLVVALRQATSQADLALPPSGILPLPTPTEGIHHGRLTGSEATAPGGAAGASGIADSLRPIEATATAGTRAWRSLKIALAVPMAVLAGALFAHFAVPQATRPAATVDQPLPPVAASPGAVGSGRSQSFGTGAAGPTTAGRDQPVIDGSTPRVWVSLRSEPPGARVRVDDREYGPTPAEIEWIGDAASPGREVTFTFEHPGRQSLVVTRTLRGDRVEVHAALLPQPVATTGAGSNALPTDNAGRGGPPDGPAIRSPGIHGATPGGATPDGTLAQRRLRPRQAATRLPGAYRGAPY